MKPPLFFVCAAACLLLVGCKKKGESPSVVLYTSQDQFYAEPILHAFTARTGIKVRPVFDTESAKTAGLANRLRAEYGYPQCDLFWSNEELHMRWLVRDRIILSNEWRAAGFRTRRVVINTNLLSLDKAPKTLLELTNSAWGGRIALSYPLFGTAASHFLALRQHWGEDLWKRWCYGLIRNAAKVVDGNSVVVKLVGAGEAWIGLTDSDDIAAGKKQGLPVAELPLSEESLVIRSTAGVVRGAPNVKFARLLLDYLTSPESLQPLLEQNALEGISPNNGPQTLQMNWDEAAGDLESAHRFLDILFVRS